MEPVVFVLALSSFAVWIGLLLFRGQFWRADQRLPEAGPALSRYPSVSAIIPARDEAEVIARSLRSLLGQDYPGAFRVVLVDDDSSDGTAEIARQAASALNRADGLAVIPCRGLPAGWTGKLWAMEQGVRFVRESNPPDYILFTDADIEHPPDGLKALAEKAETGRLALVSQMVLLRSSSFWEKLLIPAFVFFFQKLYPFRLVNSSRSRAAAAAGGCLLIRTETLARIGGLEPLKGALIDDCTLARAVKGPGRPVWLGLTEKTRSLRTYPKLSDIWEMVARTAFTQLNHSISLLALTLAGMALIYLIWPFGLVCGFFTGNAPILLLSALTALLMSIAYSPTLRLYRLSPFRALTLPLAGFLYALMTLDSAWRCRRGREGKWKGRTYKV